MLQIKRKREFPFKGLFFSLTGLLLLGTGGYILLLTNAPSLSVFLPAQPMDIAALPQPAKRDNRIIIPSINVNIPYGNDGQAALDRGAWWRNPHNGNPADGGNFIIAAHRFSIQPTPQSTVEKSPFYRLDKLKNNDPILVDYNGKRYGYKVSKIFTAAPTQTEIEGRTDQPRLTLYSCQLGGPQADRYVLFAKPMGEVAIQ